MPLTPVIAILDIGKTNKKLLLFDELYNIVWEKAEQLPETSDEDGFPCEDLENLWNWITNSLIAAGSSDAFEICAINFSAYGASMVHIDGGGKALTPLYNYLKPYPHELQKKFYDKYGGESEFSIATASPVLGSLNSGMQLYRLKYEQPEVFEKIKYSLHLPQWLSWMVSGKADTEITSIGCHTNLWNFSLDYYHDWVFREGVIDKLPPLQSSGTIHHCIMHLVAGKPKGMPAISVAGIGLHDSSAALVPYLESFQEPFVLISTGTWSISMNPFNKSALTNSELENDCLCYLSFSGKPVKASRLFAGYEYDQQLERLSEYFQTGKDFFWQIMYDPAIVNQLKNVEKADNLNVPPSKQTCSRFAQRELAHFNNPESAYHQLMIDLMELQVAATNLVLSDNVKRIFVDGGFARNPVYMHLLAGSFPSLEVFSSHIAQASATGAAVAIHDHWNKKEMSKYIIELKYFES